MSSPVDTPYWTPIQRFMPALEEKHTIIKDNPTQKSINEAGICLKEESNESIGKDKTAVNSLNSSSSDSLADHTSSSPTKPLTVYELNQQADTTKLETQVIIMDPTIEDDQMIDPIKLGSIPEQDIEQAAEFVVDFDKVNGRTLRVEHESSGPSITGSSSSSSMNTSSSNNTSNKDSLDPYKAAASDIEQKWPVPKTIEEMYTLYEQEKANGDSRSQLALCLHLLQCASKMNPENSIVVPHDMNITTPNPGTARRQLLDGIMTTLRQHSQSNPNLGQLMVKEAKQILKQLATSGQSAGQAGDAEAQFLLGSCYGMGALGWPMNHEQAFAWYLQASKQRHPEATYRVGVCYELGLGTARDGGRAVTFYKKAAHLVHVPSMYKLGVIYMRGYCGQPVIKRDAIIWLQRAAAQSDTMTVDSEMALPEALHALAIIHLNKECQDTSIIPDTQYAIKLLHDAANLGYAPSQFKLGECYETGSHVVEDEAQSIHWYTLAAKQNYAEAALALSGWYLTGSIKSKALPQSDSAAYTWVRKAAVLAKRAQLKPVAADAYYSLGIFYENGIGVKQSAEKSSKWFRRAAHLGHPECLKMLKNSNEDVKEGN